MTLPSTTWDQLHPHTIQFTDRTRSPNNRSPIVSQVGVSMWIFVIWNLCLERMREKERAKNLLYSRWLRRRRNLCCSKLGTCSLELLAKTLLLPNQPGRVTGSNTSGSGHKLWPGSISVGYTTGSSVYRERPLTTDWLNIIVVSICSFTSQKLVLSQWQQKVWAVCSSYCQQQDNVTRIKPKTTQITAINA